MIAAFEIGARQPNRRKDPSYPLLRVRLDAPLYSEIGLVDRERKLTVDTLEKRSSFPDTTHNMHDLARL